MFNCRFLENTTIPWVSCIKKAPVYRGPAGDMFILQKHIRFLADGEGFEPPEELPLQRFSRPSHSTALPPIRNCFKPAVFQTCGFVCGTSFGNCARIFYIYFLRIATVKIVAPATNIIADNNCPIVSPQLVKKPIWTSGARNCSQNMRATAYPIPNIPPKAPA